jgi:hypothetical protein
MAKKCYLAEGVNCYGVSFSAFVCSESVEFTDNGGFCGGGFFISRDLGVNQDNGSVLSGNLKRVGLSNCADCNGIKPEEPYDCINGTCLPARTYQTPGRYQNIAECQSGCLRDSNCTGECIPVAEIARLEQGAQALTAKFCS